MLHTLSLELHLPLRFDSIRFDAFQCVVIDSSVLVSLLVCWLL
jgi:hypothetical protein